MQSRCSFAWQPSRLQDGRMQMLCVEYPKSDGEGARVCTHEAENYGAMGEGALVRHLKLIQALNISLFLL